MTILRDERDLYIQVYPEDHDRYQIICEAEFTRSDSRTFVTTVPARSRPAAETLAILIGRDFCDSEMTSADYRAWFLKNREYIINGN